MPTPPKLYRAITCNFCHRAEIAFAAKGVEIEQIDIDLVRRPAWYRDMASGGSVPLMEWNGLELHPSRVINEFIDERWPEPPLLPADASERAEHAVEQSGVRARQRLRMRDARRAHSALSANCPREK